MGKSEAGKRAGHTTMPLLLLLVCLALASAAPAADFDQNSGHWSPQHNQLAETPLFEDGPDNFLFEDPCDNYYLCQFSFKPIEAGISDGYGAPSAPVIDYEPSQPAALPILSENERYYTDKTRVYHPSPGFATPLSSQHLTPHAGGPSHRQFDSSYHNQLSELAETPLFENGPDNYYLGQSSFKEKPLLHSSDPDPAFLPADLPAWELDNANYYLGQSSFKTAALTPAYEPPAPVPKGPHPVHQPVQVSDTDYHQTSFKADPLKPTYGAPEEKKKPRGILDKINSTLQKLGRRAYSWKIAMFNMITGLFL